MKHTKAREPNSIQKVIFFCIFVLLLIAISLGIRLFTLIRSSTFDGDHRYTIEIKKNAKEAKIISLDPTSKKMLVLFLKGKDDLPPLDIFLGLPIDTVVNHNTSPERSVTADLSDLLINLHVNAYDMLRLITASKAIPEEDIIRQSYEFPLPQEKFTTETKDLMIDSGITNDNKTLSIINASDTSGLGSRFGDIIEKSGGTVISVTSAPNTSVKSKLMYYGNKTYTVKKLERILHVTAQSQENKGLSDIVVTLGEDFQKGIVK